MDLKRKLEISRQAIDSIATHDDHHADVLRAALGEVRAQVDDAEAQLNARVRREIARTLGQKADGDEVAAA